MASLTHSQAEDKTPAVILINAQHHGVTSLCLKEGTFHFNGSLSFHELKTTISNPCNKGKTRVRQKLSTLFVFFCGSGSTAGHSDGSVLAVYPEHLRGDPLPQDDLDGRYWRRLRLLHHRLHVLLHSE